MPYFIKKNKKVISNEITYFSIEESGILWQCLTGGES